MSILLRTMRALMLAVPFWLAGPAQAAPISFSFSGSLDSVDPLLSSEFSVGQAFSGSFTYESSTAPTGDSDADVAFYHAVTAFSVTTGSYTATSSSPSGAAFSISIFAGFDCQSLLVNVAQTDGLTGPPVAGFPLSGAGIELNDSCNAAFQPAIPLPTSLSLSALGEGGFAVFFLHFAGQDVGGPLSTLTPAPPIPEPTALALFAIGGGVFAWFRRRKQVKQSMVFSRSCRQDHLKSEDSD